MFLIVYDNNNLYCVFFQFGFFIYGYYIYYIQLVFRIKFLVGELCVFFIVLKKVLIVDFRLDYIELGKYIFFV